jgi:MFS family permease
MKNATRLIWPSGNTIYPPAFLLAMPAGLLGVYLPLYGRDLGATTFQVGLLYAAFHLTGVIVRPLTGIAADRLGRRPFLLAGAVCYVFAAVLFAGSVSLSVLFAARLAQGLGSALFWVATYALLADLGREDTSGRRYGWLATAFTSGSILGTMASYGAVVVLGLLSGWRVSFVIFALTNLLALVLVYRNVRPQAPPLAAPAFRPAPVGVLLCLLSVSFLVAAAFGMLAPITLLYLRDRFAATEFWIGVASAPSALVYALAPGRLGTLGDRYSRRAIVAIALAASGAVSLLFPLAPSLALLSGIWILEALFVAAAVPAQDAIVSEVSGGDVRGRSFGIYAAAAGLGASAGPLVGGWLCDNVGHATPFWLNAALLPIAGAIVFWMLPEPRRTAEEVDVRANTGG